MGDEGAGPIDGPGAAASVEAFVEGELDRLLKERFGVALVIYGRSSLRYVQVALGIPNGPEDVPTGAQVEVCGPVAWKEGYLLSEAGVEALEKAGFEIAAPPDYPNWALWIEPFDRSHVASLLAMGLRTLGLEDESLGSELITRVDKYALTGGRRKS